MNKDLDEKCSEQDYIYDIAFKNIIINGLLSKAFDLEKNNIPIDDIGKNCTKVLEDVFKQKHNKIDVIKNTMKLNLSEKLENNKILDYLDKKLFPTIKDKLDMLNLKASLNQKLSPHIINIIFCTYSLFIKLIKIQMKEYEHTQKIIADSLLKKETLDEIRNKLNKKKKNTTKNNNKKEEEISITKKINESRITEIENLLNSGNNNEKIKEYISQFEKDLEEKENLIRELFFQEYIIEENYEAYREKINEQFSTITKYCNRINELEKEKKKIVSEKNDLSKTNLHLNREITRLKNQLLYIENKKNEFHKKKCELLDEIEELKNNNFTLSKKNEELNNSVSYLAKKNEELKKSLSDLSRKNEELNINLSDLLNEKEELKINNSYLFDENEGLNKKITLLAEETDASNEKIRMKNSEIEALKNEINLLKIKIESKESKIYILEKKNESMKFDNEKLLAQCEELKKLIK